MEGVSSSTLLATGTGPGTGFGKVGVVLLDLVCILIKWQNKVITNRCVKVFIKLISTLYYIIWFEISFIFVRPIPHFISFVTCQNFPAIFLSMTLRIFPSFSQNQRLKLVYQSSVQKIKFLELQIESTPSRLYY